MLVVDLTSVDPAAGPAVLLYDGDCGFCAACAARLRRWSDERLDVVAWQRADLAALGLTAAQCAAAVRHVGPDRHSAGGPAIAAALRRCRQPYRTAGIALEWPVLRPVAARVYALVAANRHRLPGSTCGLSDHDERSSGGALGQGARQPVPPAHG